LKGEAVAETKESFVRWQAITREHMSRVSDLVLGLASGAVAFLVNLLVGERSPTPCARAFALVALMAAGLSVLAALWCATNRLSDFRATTQIARRREDGATDSELGAERTRVREIGAMTWVLFRIQILLFGASTIAAAIMVLLVVAVTRV
jgi:hypothetical protein